jgi:D-alanyl-D-alanine carboxypeptidase
VIVVAVVACLVSVTVAFVVENHEEEPLRMRSSAPAATTVLPTPSAASKPLPSCRYADAPATDVAYSDWQSTLVDPTFTLPPDYYPPGLVPVSRAGFGGSGAVRSFVIPQLSALRQAAAAAGHPIAINTAFRSYGTQQAVFADSVALRGHAAALQRAARPGHSEHQLGTTIDFESAGMVDVTQAWGSTPAGTWMAENAWRYGFVLSYPKNRKPVTCYDWEPWHFRFFGVQVAAQIHASGLTTRQYLWDERGR